MTTTAWIISAFIAGAVIMFTAMLIRQNFLDLMRRLSDMEARNHRELNNDQLEEIENSLSCLGKYMYLNDRNREVLESGINHLVNMKQRGNRKGEK